MLSQTLTERKRNGREKGEVGGGTGNSATVDRGGCLLVFFFFQKFNFCWNEGDGGGTKDVSKVEKPEFHYPHPFFHFEQMTGLLVEEDTFSFSPRRFHFFHSAIVRLLLF